MKFKDLEFKINEYNEDEAFFKITDTIEGQVIRIFEELSEEYKYDCFIWNNTCTSNIDLGCDLDEYQINDIIITLTY